MNIRIHTEAVISPITLSIKLSYAEAPTWLFSKIGGGGHVLNVIPSYTDSNVPYAYVDIGGLYRSEDGSERWHMLNQHLGEWPQPDGRKSDCTIAF